LWVKVKSYTDVEEFKVKTSTALRKFVMLLKSYRKRTFVSHNFSLSVLFKFLQWTQNKNERNGNGADEKLKENVCVLWEDRSGKQQ
jgi:hypothetical protein